MIFYRSSSSAENGVWVLRFTPNLILEEGHPRLLTKYSSKKFAHKIFPTLK